MWNQDQRANVTLLLSQSSELNMKAFILTSMITSMIRTHKSTCVLSATNRANRCASCTMDTIRIRSLSSRPFHCSKAVLLPASSGFLTANQKERRLLSGHEIVWKTAVQKRKLDECISVDHCVSELIKLINPYLDSLDLSVFCDKVCFLWRNLDVNRLNYNRTIKNCPVSSRYQTN